MIIGRTPKFWPGAGIWIVTAFLGLPCAHLQAAIIYRETFGIPPGAGADFFPTTFDWQRFDQNGFEITTGGNTSGVNYSAQGRPVDVANVNAGPNSDGTFDPYANGILYFASALPPSLGFTTEFSFNPADYLAGSISFSWYEGNNSALQSFRLAIRNSSGWFASADPYVFTTPAIPLTSFGTQAELKTLTYNPAAANWLTMTFDGDFTLGATPGTGTATNSTLGALSLGGPPATDLSGAITAFGVYGESGTNPNGNRRIDTFQIDATPVPEPSSVLLLALGGAFVGAVRHRG
jgi:hypothetical protein